MPFRENLKLQVSYAGMTVQQLADLSGVNKFTIDSYLNNRCRMPSADAALRIARTLGVTVEQLFGPVDTPGAPADTPRQTSKEGKQQKLLREARDLAKQAQELVDMLEGFGSG